MKKDKKILGAGLLTALASSLCCISPVLALISGTSGVALAFGWLEPFRPYLIGFTVLILAFAWYQKLKAKKEIECDCEADEKPSFLQSKLFLGIITIFAIIMTVFPYYSTVFYPKTERAIIVVDNINIQSINIDIEGMTCTSCEEHITYSIAQLQGIIKVKTSYENGNVEIEFDNSISTIEEIEKVVNETGYSVINTKEKEKWTLN